MTLDWRSFLAGVLAGLILGMALDMLADVLRRSRTRDNIMVIDGGKDVAGE